METVSVDLAFGARADGALRLLRRAWALGRRLPVGAAEDTRRQTVGGAGGALGEGGCGAGVGLGQRRGGWPGGGRVGLRVRLRGRG